MSINYIFVTEGFDELIINTCMYTQKRRDTEEFSRTGVGLLRFSHRVYSKTDTLSLHIPGAPEPAAYQTRPKTRPEIRSDRV